MNCIPTGEEVDQQLQKQQCLWKYQRYILVCWIIFLFLPARRYASAGNSDRNVSVCPSVRPSRAGIVSKRRKLAA